MKRISTWIGRTMAWSVPSAEMPRAIFSFRHNISGAVIATVFPRMKDENNLQKQTMAEAVAFF